MRASTLTSPPFCSSWVITLHPGSFLHAPSRRKASRVEEKLYLDQQHTHNKKTCTDFLHCLGRDGVTSSHSVPPLTLMIFFTSSSIAFFLSLFSPSKLFSCSGDTRFTSDIYKLFLLRWNLYENNYVNISQKK